MQSERGAARSAGVSTAEANAGGKGEGRALDLRARSGMPVALRRRTRSFAPEPFVFRMHPRLAELLAHADQTRAELLAFLDSIPADVFGAPRDDGAWCPAQYAAHLHLVESSSLRALFRAFRTARAAGLAAETETSSVVGALDRTDLVAGTRKLDAPEFTRPSDLPDRATIRARLAESRAGLHTWAAEADGFALAQVSFPHPVLGTLNLYEWVAMIDGHERRHLRQMQAQLADPQH